MNDWRFRRAVREVLLAIEGCCWYCGCELAESWEHGIAATIDHFVPRVRGGGDDAENLKLSCERCNRRKSAYTVAWCVFRLNGHSMMFGRERRHFLRKLSKTVPEPIRTIDDDWRTLTRREIRKELRKQLRRQIRRRSREAAALEVE